MHLDWLLERFSRYGGVHALVAQDCEVTYMELLARIGQWRAKLADDRIEAGDVIAIEGDISDQSVALLLALINHGCTVLPLSPSAAGSRDEFFRIAQAASSYSFSGESLQHLRYQQQATNPLLLELRRRKHPGLILFSSGSTGEHKGALHDLLPMLKKYEMPRRTYRTLCLMQFDHIGGFNTLLYTLANGGCLIPAKQRSPQNVCSLIERHKAELLPTTPTFLDLMLLSGCDFEYDLSSLKLITYGTEVARESTLKKIRERIPHAQILQTYGLTEVGILRSKSREDGSLWIKVGGEGYETKIIDNTLWIRANSAMLGYLNAESPFDGNGWMNTHDKVEVDGEWIRILGRTTDIINVGGEKVYPAEVENILLQIENIRDAVVFGKPNPLLGNIVAARVLLHHSEEVGPLKQRVWAYFRERVSRYKIPTDLEIVSKLSVSPRQKKLRGIHADSRPVEVAVVQAGSPGGAVRGASFNQGGD